MTDALEGDLTLRRAAQLIGTHRRTLAKRCRLPDHHPRHVRHRVSRGTERERIYIPRTEVQRLRNESMAQSAQSAQVGEPSYQDLLRSFRR